MIAAVLKETWPAERRVAVVPAVLPSLAKAGVEVVLEAGAGLRAGYPDEEYEERGAKVLPSADDVVALADLVLTVRSLAGGGKESGLERLRRGQIVAGFLEPLRLPEGARALAERGVTAFALELVPRITRAQTMDALSSTATVVGYKAVLLAADRLPRMFPMLMTAAGTVAPARVLVIGAGVAGLQAIATARRLGAAVEAYDLRPAVKDQVRSLGARFVELPLEAEDAEDENGYARPMDEDFYRRQSELLAARVAEQDVVITAAAVPGRKAPVLVTEQMVRSMRPGSVIVDVAGEQGGNCASSDPGATVERHGVTVMAPLNLAATIPYHASQLYAKNLASFVANLVKGGRIELDLGDEILRESLVARDGEVVSARVREALGLVRQPA